ncbi:protein JTB-like [Lytechinus variegatus]|uniref:protein JTB-like n=1 Tax=Lytechinus variegatus TaxID=7654 RepID=UPI001BB28624|nr:protein JTB-like [Lytechinus variegatus]XP_041464141.1 protein JTB-like [Lytechinus variegatus]XP_041464142.1 protein JTB-like [Lytechinus variegatus]
MWKTLVDICLTGIIATLLILNINTMTVLGAPVEDREERGEQENEKVEFQKTEEVGSPTPCWETENFTYIGSCDPCHLLASKVFTDSCSETGFQQLVQCTESNQQVYKSCPRSRELIEKSFWVFEGVMFFVGLFAFLVVYVRRRKLNREAAERVRKQISNSA